MTIAPLFGDRPPTERLFPLLDPLVERLARALGIGHWRERDLRRLRAMSLLFVALVWTGGVGAMLAFLLQLQPHHRPVAFPLLALQAGLVFAASTAGMIVATTLALRMHRRLSFALAGCGINFAEIQRILIREEAYSSASWTGTGTGASFRLDGPSLGLLLEGDPRGTSCRLRIVRLPDGHFDGWVAARACDCEPWQANPDLDFGPLRDLHAFVDAVVAIAERHRPRPRHKPADFSVN